MKYSMHMAWSIIFLNLLKLRHIRAQAANINGKRNSFNYWRVKTTDNNNMHK